MPGESADTDVESLTARLALALEAGAVAEWSVRVDSGEWLLATRLDTVFGDGIPVDADAANADARAHTGERSGFPLADASFARRLDRQGRQALVRAWHELIDVGGKMRVEARVLRADGEPRRIRVDGLLTSAGGGGARRASGFVRDVTEQKRLGEINSFLARLSLPLAGIGNIEDTLQSIAGDVVPFLADRCVIDFVTPEGSLVCAADSHLPPERPPPLPAGQPAGRVPDAPLIERIVRERRTLVLTDLDQAAIRDLSVTEERRAELEAYRPCDYLGAPLIADGRCFGVLGILTRLDGDRRFLEHEIGLVERIAERLSAALDNARLYASLKESERRKDLFLATLSHELRNPIGAISNGIEALRDSIVDPGDRTVLAGIDRQMQSLSRMLDDLLDVARISEDKLELVLGRVSLGTLLSDVERAVAPAFRERDQRFHVSPPEPDIVLRADRTRLEQIIVNLLVNAGHYTPAGGHIALRAWREGEEANGGERVRIEVSDDGVGLDAAQRERVFDYFVQFREAGGPSAGGLGLGLGLVRRLVGLHDGTIEVESEGKGQGSTFRVTLPIASEEGSPPLAGDTGAVDPTDPTGGGAAPPGTGEEDSLDILLVEDNVDAANALERVLVRSGHRVLTVHDGAAAASAFERKAFSLVLLDLGLPDIDGYAVARHVRTSPGGTDCTLVALTGYGQAGDRERTLAAGFDDHLVKPIKVAALRDIVARIAARQRD